MAHQIEHGALPLSNLPSGAFIHHHEVFMGFTLIKGTFHLDAGIPDGDSVRFMADDDRLFDGLRGRPVEFKADGTVQLRYEGIDSIEKAAIQPLAGESRDKNFELLREAVDPFTDTPADSSSRGKQTPTGGRSVSRSPAT